MVSVGGNCIIAAVSQRVQAINSLDLGEKFHSTRSLTQLLPEREAQSRLNCPAGTDVQIPTIAFGTAICFSGEPTAMEPLGSVRSIINLVLRRLAAS